MLDQGNLSSHDASGLNLHPVIHRHRRSYLLDIVDAQFDICLLEGRIRRPEGAVDLRLDSLCLVNQLHQLPNQYIPLFIHESVAHIGQAQ